MYEDKLREIISYNNYFVEYKNNYPRIKSDVRNNDVEMGGIMCVNDKIASKMVKSKVNIDLLRSAQKSEKFAMIARDELETLIESHKKTISQNEKIYLYKKAILELKEEGKL